MSDGSERRRVLAIAAVVLLHLALLGGGMLADASHHILAAVALGRGVSPREPLVLLTTVALLMTQCSLGAVWWARTRWPSHIKTLVAVAVCLAIWGLLLLLLEQSRSQPDRAAGWAAAMGTQAVLTAVAIALLEFRIDYEWAMRNSRFSILFLMLWMAVVAMLLGGGRWLAGRFGWTLGNFFAWEYFLQLQVIGISNAVLASGLVASIRIPTMWAVRIVASTIALVLVTATTAMTMELLFGKNVGASRPDIIWLMVFQGLFLLATLLPLEIAGGADRPKRLP